MATLRASVTADATGLQDGDPAPILLDGADTPITANGLTGYLPTPGDRLLVQRVGSQVEVVQYLSRGTIPYLTGTDLSDLQGQVDSNTDAITDANNAVSATNNTLTGYMTLTDQLVTGFQSGYDVLTGLGAAGVQEDYIWVGDDPALSTVKPVQISTFVQAGLGAGDELSFAEYFGLWDKDDIGDLTADGPMTVFYNAFVAAGLSAEAWNA